MSRLLLALALGLFAPISASAARLEVGAGRVLKLPSDAARIAHDGDVIAIDPGTYSDCAIWRRRNLTVAGTGPGVVIGGKACGGKGIFIAAGANLTIRRVTLTGAHGPSHNAAGILVLAPNLTVEASRFIGNENGILTSDIPDGTITIEGSEFRDNGTCEEACAHGIYIGHIAALRVERSLFRDTHAGHHIKSRARETTVTDCTIEDGPSGSSSYLIDIPNGGAVQIERNRMEKGRLSDNPAVAISIGEEGLTNPTPFIAIRGNTFTNKQTVGTVFVRDLTHTPAELGGNILQGDVIPLDGPGSVR